MVSILKDLNWALISQIFSYVIAIISSLVSFLNNRKNNKTIKEIELTKQKFALENEQLKRNQAIQDHKTQLITHFLGAINAYQASHRLDIHEEAMRACGEVISVCTPEQKKLVNEVLSALNEMKPRFTSQETWDRTAKIIAKATLEFNSSSKKPN